MTIRRKIFFFILGFRFLVANAVPLDISIVPKINCNDLNRNGIPDFIAFDNSFSSRTLYHLDVTSTTTKILWEYTIPESNNGYFVDLIIGDFDNNGIIELIASSYQDGSNKIFYIFSADASGFYNTDPVIIGVENNSNLNNPGKMYSMQPDAYGQSLFLLTQGSPNRQVLMCTFIEGVVTEVGSIGKEFLKNTMGPIDLALGDFDGDGGEDIFILNNSSSPSGYYIYSNGKEEPENLKGYPRLRLLHDEGVDINFDGKDDLIIASRDNELMSNIWVNETIPLSNEKIHNIIINPDNGFVYLTSISSTGVIGNYSIDPLSKGILSSDFIQPTFGEIDYKNVNSLVIHENIILVHDGKQSEYYLTPLANELITDTPPPMPTQRIYNQNPDFVVNVGEKFSHKIQWQVNATFRNFTEISKPEGMSFDLENLSLNWTPKSEQLGYHELSYLLELREKGKRKIDDENGKIFVSQNEAVLEKPFSYLLYVNEPISINLKTDSITIVNNELFEWEILIDDKNGDAQITVEIHEGSETAEFKLIQPEITLIPIENQIDEVTNLAPVLVENIEPEIITEIKPVIEETEIESIQKPKDEPVYVDTVQTEFEKFAEEKLSAEEDPFKKKKQESSVEEFKTKEEQYREKLKTHKKILKDGKNIWVPKDSLIVNEESEDSIQIIDVIEPPEEKEIEEAPVDETTIVMDKVEIPELEGDEIEPTISIPSTPYVEISHTELVQHKSQFSWKPSTNPGDYFFTVVANDRFTSDSTTFVITVHPEIDLSQNNIQHTATVDQMFHTSLKLKQSPPSEKFEYLLINAPENLRIDSAGVINWVPLPTQVDDYNFQIEVSDGIATSIQDYEIYVNAPPVISSRPGEIYILQIGEQIDFQLESFDLNSNANLEWKFLNGPADMTLSPQGVLRWEGRNLGHHPYQLQLSDGIDSVQYNASIYVNAPPIFTSKPIVSVPKGERYEYPLFATDENSISPIDSLAENKIIFTLAQGPEGMVIENDVLVWETGDNHLGEYMAAITANDGAEDAIQAFPVFINSFPVITSQDSVTVQFGDTLLMQIEAYDPNPEDTLTFHLESLRQGLVLEIHSGLLTWSPEVKDIGLHTFTLQVKDGHDNNGTIIPFSIFVYTPPKLTSDLATEAYTGLEYTEFLTAEDLYGKKLSSPESIIIDTATFKYYNLSEYAHLFKWTPREVDMGNHEIVIKLTDEFGFTTYHTHNLSVFTNPCVHCNNEHEDAPADSTR